MSEKSEMNWDHLRMFLAVMRSGSLRQAAERLELSHPTLRRRLEAFEDQLGLRLFERRPDGLHPRPEASALFEKAREVESSIYAFGRCASSVDPVLQGSIHITAPDLLMSDLLAPDLAAFTKRWPQIDLRVDTSYELADLGNREADVAIRLVPYNGQPHEDLAGKKVATAYTAIYGEKHQWIGWGDRVRQDEWIQKTPFADLPVFGSLNNVFLHRSACHAGMGLAILPCFMADSRLKRHTEPEPSSDIWILVHPDLRRNPRLRLFRDEMVKALERHRPILEGHIHHSRSPMMTT